MSVPPRLLSPAQATLIGAVATVAYALPPFLTGAMAVQITGELAFGAAGLGLAVGLFRGSAALTSVPLGRVVDRLGATRSLRLSCLITVAATLGIATTARGWASLVAWLVLGGCANAVGQPAANRLLSRRVRPERQGLAFGLKQSAPPTAAMLAGLAVPLVAVTIGWRWAFVFSGCLALAVMLAVGRNPTPAPGQAGGPRVRTAPLQDHPTIVVLAAGLGLGIAAASSVPTFFVDAVVRAGMPGPTAGTMLAVASICAIATRVVVGAAADRMPTGHLRLCAAMLAVGLLGFTGLVAGRPAPMAAGAVVVLTAGWGCNGVFWYALVRANADAPGRVTGAVAPGGLLGGSLGPITFGLVAEHWSYGAAWGLAGLLAIGAVAAMLVGSHRLATPGTRWA